MSVDQVRTQQALVLEVDRLRAGYMQAPVLKAVSLSVPLGSWYSVLGPNGIGKSTLLKTIVGELIPVGGTVKVCGVDAVRDRVAALRQIGFASAPERLPGLLTGRQCLEVYAAAKELSSVDADVIELLRAFKFDSYLDRFVDTYSLGTRQKLCVLLALLGAPRLILLDEAFNGLDPASALLLKRELRHRIDARQCSVVVATHALDVVTRYSDHAALLFGGAIVRTWDRAALAELQARGEDAVEQELAAVAGSR